MLKKIMIYIVLIVLALFMLIPFYMMFVMSTLSTDQIFSFPPKIWFGKNFINNMNTVITRVNLLRTYFNSCCIAIGNTALVLFFCSIGGYAFAVYEFRFKKQLFGLLLLTIMIPGTAGIIPWFIMMSKFGWINSFRALIIPGSANAFGIFWMRQYCQKNVPSSLLDAARIDGCSEWTIFFRVVAPIILPAYAGLGIMQFVGVWNDFMTPMMILRKTALATLPVMLRALASDQGGTDYGAVMATSTCVVLPLLIVFLISSRYFMSGLTAGAIKE